MAVITSIGTANPAYKRSQLETAALVSAVLDLAPAEKRLLKSIYKATGIEFRHSVLSDYSKNPGEYTFFPNHLSSPFPTTSERMKIYKDNACDLALAAITDCLSTLDNFNKADVTHVITVSCTGMYAPGIDIEIVQKLNLPSHTKRTAINFMGCYGAFNALKAAESICHAEPAAVVLVVCVELCTIHFQKNKSLENITANAIFSDGAAAVIVQNKLNTNKKGLVLESFYCDLLPKSHQEMTWDIGNQGFDIALSSYVPDIIQFGIADFMRKINHKFILSNIDFFAIHPGGQKILQGCEKVLGITPEKNKYAYKVLRQYGNMSSPTILFVLKEIWDDFGKDDHHKTIFGCAFGPGLTLETMFLRTHYV